MKLFTLSRFALRVLCGASITLVALSFFWVGCEKSPAPENQVQTSAPTTQGPPVLSSRTLVEAINQSKPNMSDTYNEVSPGAVQLARWAAGHLKWADLRMLPVTTHALVMKDPDLERGKAVFVSGTIIEIHATNLPWGKIYDGGFSYYGMNNTETGVVLEVYRFAAVGSTGSLVAGGHATFGGVVIGKQDYANSAGGTEHAVYLVGMFDLPENKGN